MIKDFIRILPNSSEPLPMVLDEKAIVISLKVSGVQTLVSSDAAPLLMCVYGIHYLLSCQPYTHSLNYWPSLETFSLATSLSTMVVITPSSILSNSFLVIITGFGQASPLASITFSYLYPPNHSFPWYIILFLVGDNLLILFIKIWGIINCIYN